MRRRFFSCRGEALEVRNLLSAAVPEPPAAIATDESAMVEPLAADVLNDDQSISYPGGVTVTPTEIRTLADTIPRFVAQPTITTVRSGLWTDPLTWSGQRVPTDNDLVLIQPGTFVAYSTQSEATHQSHRGWRFSGIRHECRYAVGSRHAHGDAYRYAADWHRGRARCLASNR